MGSEPRALAAELKSLCVRVTSKFTMPTMGSEPRALAAVLRSL